MAESSKLGKVEKPSAEEFQKGRKLLFLPLVYVPDKAPDEFKEIVKRYWQQAAGHIDGLEAKLPPIKRVYHEWVTVSGEEGLKAIETIQAGSHDIVKPFNGKGAEIQSLEDKELLDEFLDWGRCISIGLVSKKAFSEVYKSYMEAQKKRQECISKRIDETLKGDEVGLLVMREGHQIQFPCDIQVFYVAPPALDEIRRWLRDNVDQPKKTRAEQKQEEMPEKDQPKE